MTEMLKEFYSPDTSQIGRENSLLIPHLLRRLSSPSPDAEPFHFSFLFDAYAYNSVIAF